MNVFHETGKVLELILQVSLQKFIDIWKYIFLSNKKGKQNSAKPDKGKGRSIVVQIW